MGRPRKRPTFDEFVLNVKKRLESGLIDEKQAEKEYLRFTKTQDSLEDLRYYHTERPTSGSLFDSQNVKDIDGDRITINRGKSHKMKALIREQEYGHE